MNRPDQLSPELQARIAAYTTQEEIDACYQGIEDRLTHTIRTLREYDDAQYRAYCLGYYNAPKPT